MLTVVPPTTLARRPHQSHSAATASCDPGRDPLDGGAAGMVGAEDLPEERPEGQPRGVGDGSPSRSLLLEDQADQGLRKHGVEPEIGPGNGVVLEPGDLEAEPWRGKLTHAGAPCGGCGLEYPHHPASEVPFHPPSGQREAGKGKAHETIHADRWQVLLRRDLVRSGRAIRNLREICLSFFESSVFFVVPGFDSMADEGVGVTDDR